MKRNKEVCLIYSKTLAWRQWSHDMKAVDLTKSVNKEKVNLKNNAHNVKKKKKKSDVFFIYKI